VTSRNAAKHWNGCHNWPIGTNDDGGFWVLTLGMGPFLADLGDFSLDNFL
jgi:hypothetical protein